MNLDWRRRRRKVQRWVFFLLSIVLKLFGFCFSSQQTPPPRFALRVRYWNSEADDFLLLQNLIWESENASLHVIASQIRINTKSKLNRILVFNWTAKHARKLKACIELLLESTEITRVYYIVFSRKVPSTREAWEI